MDSITMKKKFDRIPDLPTLPQVAMKVNELMQEPIIRAVMERDAVREADLRGLLARLGTAYREARPDDTLRDLKRRARAH